MKLRPRICLSSLQWERSRPRWWRIRLHNKSPLGSLGWEEQWHVRIWMPSMSHWSNSAPARRLAPFLQAATDNIYIQSHLCVTLMCNRIQPPAPSPPSHPCLHLFVLPSPIWVLPDMIWGEKGGVNTGSHSEIDGQHGPVGPQWAIGPSDYTIECYYMVSYGNVWYSVVLCGTGWYRVVSYGVLNELSDHLTLWRLSTTTPSPWLSERRGKVSEDTRNEKKETHASKKSLILEIWHSWFFFGWMNPNLKT